jgi:hypothetical protein
MAGAKSVGGAVVAVAVAVALATLGVSARAEAHSRAGYHYGSAVYMGFGPYLGYGFGPYVGPYAGGYFRPEGGIDLGVAMVAGFGAVNLNVKPKEAEVWVDGKYVAEAQNLDGSPSYLWLKKGSHHLVIYKGGFAPVEEDVDVMPGMKTDFKVRLQKGDAPPPGHKPAEVR